MHYNMQRIIKEENMTTILELTKKLVSIPSWVGTGCNEIQVGEFIYSWLQSNTNMSVIKQPVKDGRFNIIATDASPTRLILAGHIDTVESGKDWATDPYAPTLKKGRLYGRGSTDMKGSLAAMLTAVSEAKNTAGIMVLCYIDEEYDFAGMLKFVEEYQSKIKPELIVSLDGYADTIGYACRGLIEVRFKVRGKSGHAGRPELAKNAILIGTKIVNNVIDILKPGGSSCNLAYLNGGLDLGDDKIGEEGNNIANIAELVLDIRPSSSDINSDKIKEIIAKLAADNFVTIENWTTRHNLGSWNTPPSIIQSILNIPGNYEPFKGYVDTQMLWGAWDQVPCCAIGASTLSCAHGTDEYVVLTDLETTYQNVKNIINNYQK